MGKWDNEIAERDFRMNPPADAPGQGSDGWNIDVGGQSASDINSSAFSGSNGDVNVNNILNGGGSFGNGVQNGQPVNAQEFAKQYTATEDKIIDGSIKAIKFTGKGLNAFFSEMYRSFTNNKQSDWHVLGEQITKMSIGACLVGLFFAVLSPFVSAIHSPGWIICGGMEAAIVGVLLMMLNAKESESKYNAPVQEEIPEPVPESSASDFDWGEDKVEEGNAGDSFDWGDDDDGFDWDNAGDDLFESVDDTDAAGGAGFNVDSAIENATAGARAGMYTRQYLYETMCSVLPKITPGFAKMQQVSEGSDEFMEMSDILRSAAYQVGTKEENIPDLTEMRKNIFIIQLRATRPAGLKEQDIADAVADAYSRDADGRVVKDGVYATVDSTVGILIINIFTGDSAMVSLRDVYGEIQDFVLNPDNRMPFVWGVSELGQPWYCDLINCDSIIISGEARGGKSWKGQSIVAQLCMYNSPKEVEFYVFDHKNAASDYKYLSTVMPHVRYFCGDANKINSGIQKVLDITLKETGKILSDAGCINIKDYNETHPDNKLPYKYILIDELMSLMDAYDKDQQAEFRKLMSTIVSKLPYVGIRMILFPHRIVDYVISKNTYSLVSSRAVVRQLNQNEIKNAMGVTRKEFPYSLVNNGDMAIRSKEIAKGKTVFCHAEVLTKSNDGNKDLFRFIGSVWKKLEPECECITIQGSVGGRIGYVRGGESRVAEPVQSREAVDHTAGMGSYQYRGYSDAGSMIDMDTGDSSVGAEEDDFWDELLQGSDE